MILLSSRESSQVYSISLKFNDWSEPISFIKSAGIAGFYGRAVQNEVILTTCETGYYKFSGLKYSDLCQECPPGKRN